MNVQSPRFPLFDSLRAIAALCVVAFHAAFAVRVLLEPGYGRFLVQLNVGVAIFFLISGFLLYRPFVHARFLDQPRPSLVPYAIRRFARIVPAYWVAITIVAVWIPISGVFTPHGLLAYYGFAQVYDTQTLREVILQGGLGQTWTLAVEVSFYAVLPLWVIVQRRLPARSLRHLVITEALPLIAIFAIGSVWVFTQIGTYAGAAEFGPTTATLPYFLDHFALGMGLAVASVALAGRERQPRAVRVIERAPWVPWAFAALSYVVLCELGSRFNSVDAEPFRHELRGLVALGLLLPAVFGDDRGGAIRRLLADRRLQWVGLVSYSLFIWHLPVMVKLARGGLIGSLGKVGFGVAGLAVSLAVAAVSFYVVERPAIRLARRLAGRPGYLETARPPAGSEDRPGAPSIELAGEKPAAGSRAD